MSIWWSELGTTLQIFYLIALSTSAVLLFQLLLMFLGLDGDGDFDPETGDSDTGVLSIRTLAAFFTGFGWTGVACLQAGWSLGPTLIVSLLSGGAFMFAVLFTMRTLYGMRYEGTLNYRNAIGKVGVVYLRIPPDMSGPGQVEVTVQGRSCVIQAFTSSTEPIPNQTRVVVSDVLDENTLIVEPMGGPAPKEAES